MAAKIKTAKPKKVDYFANLLALEEAKRVAFDAWIAESKRLTRECDERFKAMGGCTCCKGTGKFTYRPTMDYFNEYETIGCLYTPENRNEDGSSRYGGWSVDRDAPFCTEETRAATKRFLCRTPEEVANIERLHNSFKNLEDEIALEKDALEPKANRMVRVFKGRKLPLGDYQCRKVGEGDYGPYCLLADASGKTTFVSKDNCIGLVECPKCHQHGTRQELRLNFVVGACCVCCDRMQEDGVLPVM